jgi:hypothetical protein
MATTPNLGLILPAHGAPNWDTPLNENFGTVDGVVGGGVAGQVLTSNGPGVKPTYQSTLTPVDNEVPIGAINGTNGSDGNAQFALLNAPNPQTSLHLTKNGQEVYVGIAFTLLGNVITYLAGYIPKTGDSHRATYRF